MRRLIDLVLAQLARVAVGLTSRRLEIIDADRIPRDRPVLVVANHFNGFMDPLVVIAVLRRLPRFLAKATLWKVLLARPFLALAGLIPVHRREDDGAGANNRGTFEAAERALRQRQTVAIFPEGITHDDPRLADIRTGAARIALGARASGAEDVAIVPIGLLFEDKVAVRTRVLARVGRPIEIEREAPALLAAGPQDDGNREAVRVLTELLTERLREVTPDFPDRWEHAELGMAADVALRPEPTLRQEPVPMIDRERLAQRLSASPGGGAVRAAIQRYATRLHLVDVDDADLLAQGGVVGWARRLITVGVGLAFVYLLLLPGLVFSAIPAVLVVVAGWIPEAPVTKGTVRALTGFVLFLATWITVAVLAADTAVMRVAWFLYQVVALLIALPILEYTYGWLRSSTSWWHLRAYRSRIPELLADRAAVVDAVEEAGRAARRPRPARRSVVP